MSEHDLKTLPDYWDAVDRGAKNFEVRRDDRGFQKGDILRLHRMTPTRTGSMAVECDLEGKPKRTLRRRVIWVMTGGQFGIEPGYVVMAIEPEPRHE